MTSETRRSHCEWGVRWFCATVQYICEFSVNVCAFLSAVYAAFVVSAVLKMKAIVYKERSLPFGWKRRSLSYLFWQKQSSPISIGKMWNIQGICHQQFWTTNKMYYKTIAGIAEFGPHIVLCPAQPWATLKISNKQVSLHDWVYIHDLTGFVHQDLLFMVYVWLLWPKKMDSCSQKMNVLYVVRNQ